MFEKIIDHFAERWLDRQLKKHPVGEPPTDADLTVLEDRQNGVITIHTDGVEVKHPKSVAFAKWDDIREILAYKRDLLTIDLDCLALCTTDDAPVVEPNEGMEGFVALWRDLESRFPAFKESYERWIISSPAFDAEPTSIWKRET
jgi:hypothetical protein